MSGLLLLLALTRSPADTILGRWEGTSTCIKAEWNRACHDEVVRYDFVRDPARHEVVLLHAYKQVDGQWESMGDLEVAWDSAGRRWVGEFSNPRVHIEWSYWIRDARLLGELVTLPGRRKTRDVVVHR